MIHNGRESLTPSQLIQRIMSHAWQRGDCLIWAGGKTTDGKPQIAWRRKTYTAQRLLLQLLKPAYYAQHRNDFLRTTCENVLCVNPQHFKMVPRGEVIKESFGADGRRSGAYALRMSIAKSKQAKLGVDKAKAAWGLRAQGRSFASIAKHFGVSKSTAASAIKRWQERGLV